MACSTYVFLPACCSCCVASSPLYVSPGCLDAHWTRPFVPGCTTVGCRCLQRAHRYLGHELGDDHGISCSGYVFLPACCSCCVASSPLYVSPGCLDAHWTRPFVPGCTTVECRCLQRAHRYLGHELGDGHEYACSTYVFLPACCSCCVASSPLYVSPGCLDAHWTRPFVPGCTTVECRCLQPAHRYLGHELGDEHG